MEQTILLVIDEKERQILVHALNVLRSEYDHIAQVLTNSAMVSGFSSDALDIANLSDRIRDLEVSDSPAARDAKIVGLLKINHKIDAIKYMRSQTNMSLKDAKDYVDHIQAQYGL